MKKQPEKNTWVYVAVENPGTDERYVGYTDDRSKKDYIPAFYNKDEAQSCFINMPRNASRKYEIQAVIFDHLARDAAAGGFAIFMLDSSGGICHEIDPRTVSGIDG